MSIIRALTLGVVATLAGFILQCASDPTAINGLLDGGPPDAIGGEALAADAGTGAKTWFTIISKTPGGVADTMLAKGSGAQASYTYNFSGSSLIHTLNSISLYAYNSTRKTVISIILPGLTISKPGTYTVNNRIVNEYKRSLGEPVQDTLSGTVAQASLEIVKMSDSLVVGSYTVSVSKSGQVVRNVSGNFEIVPALPVTGDHLRP